jgi:hypothetical protein
VTRKHLYLPERCWVVGRLVVILNPALYAKNTVTNDVWGWTTENRYFRGRLWRLRGRSLVIGWIR